MSYRVKKIIQQYSLVDILEIKMHPTHPEFQQAMDELKKRNPSAQELSMATKGLQYRLRTRNKSLSVIDKIYCLLVPFMTSHPTISGYSDAEDLYEDQLNEFLMHNETKRATELKRWQRYGRIFHLTLAALIFLTVLILYFIHLLKQL